MNPQAIQELLKQRNVQIGVIGGVVLIVVIVIMIAVMGGGGKKTGDTSPVLKKEQLTIAKIPTDQSGKAIEIQALMARNNLQIESGGDGGTTIDLSLPEGSTVAQKDRALIALVQSGLIDKNIGLEAFDKGDLTASREEKRIKLTRAQQGEISRLIRKIPPIQDASVSLSIPEQTLFRNQQKPMSASVQVTLSPGTRLERDKVRSIINLITGSIQGLDAQHVALTDTNGEVYNSVLDLGSELNDKLEEQDTYMKGKVSSQLDKLVGAGHYVVTVSTLLREAPKEMLSQSFDPDGSVVTSKQSFNENLNANARQDNVGGPTSTLLPPGLTTNAGAGNSKKDYDRNGQEVTYDNTKVQTYETRMPGMLEDISVAVTIDKAHFPSIPKDALQQLLARAASPKVDSNNVSIAVVDFQSPDILTTPSNQADDSEDGAGMGWIPWAAGSVAVCLLLLVIVSFIRGGRNNDSSLIEIQLAQQELQQLKELATQQQAQIQAAQQQTQMLIENQRQQLHQPAQPASIAQAPAPQTNELKQTLSELQQAVAQRKNDDEDIDLQIKSWIESS